MKPGGLYRWARRAAQAGMFALVFVAPFLGGWQRLDRNNLANWDAAGWDLPASLLGALPLGTAPATAYQANQLLGGGAVSGAFGLPAVDPLAGAVGLAALGWDWRLVVAWLLPLLLSVIGGRLFCGWLCPFGTLARWVDRVLERVPWRPPVVALPTRRPVRWLVLGVTLLTAFSGTQIVLYAALPHVVLQMSVYGVWLMGGGGAALGWLLALLVVGLVFGPTTYCAAVCPTGAALSLGGRVRRVHVYIAEPSACGRGCALCTRACWLQLDPASGTPGADCDLCTRCFTTCPKTNLRVGRLPRIAASASALFLCLLVSPAVDAAPDTTPRLLLDRVVRQGDVQVAVSLVDQTGVQLDADDPFAESGVELTVQLLRGPIPAPDAQGRVPFREAYEGPLVLHFAGQEHRFEAPNSPRSSPRRRQYRLRTHQPISPTDAVVLAPIEGWLSAPLVVRPRAPRGQDAWPAFGLGVLIFGGLLLAAGAVARPGGSRRPGSARPSAARGA